MLTIFATRLRFALKVLNEWHWIALNSVVALYSNLSIYNYDAASNLKDDFSWTFVNCPSSDLLQKLTFQIFLVNQQKNKQRCRSRTVNEYMYTQTTNPALRQEKAGISHHNPVKAGSKNSFNLFHHGCRIPDAGRFIDQTTNTGTMWYCRWL